MGWWPFRKKREQEEVEQHFREMLEEALLRQDDLEEATKKLRQAREKRKEPRPKLKSQPT